MKYGVLALKVRMLFVLLLVAYGPLLRSFYQHDVSSLEVLAGIDAKLTAGG